MQAALTSARLGNKKLKKLVLFHIACPQRSMKLLDLKYTRVDFRPGVQFRSQEKIIQILGSMSIAFLEFGDTNS